MKEREKTTLSGNGLSRGRVRRKHFAKRGMAYFLTFLMLMGSVQTVTYAEENAKEIAGHLELGEEKPSLEETEALVKTEERTDRPEEAVTSETTVSSDTTGESEEGSSLKETGGKDKTELSSSEDGNEAIGSEEKKEDSSEQKAEEELSEEEKAKLSEEGKKEEEKAEYLEAGTFSMQSENDVLVTASYKEGTFLEGTYMKVVPLREEAVIEEAKALLEKDYQKKNPGVKPEIEVLEAVDVSFYREIEGVEKEVQPKNGKKVEIRLQKTEKIKDALLEEEKEVQLVHLPEGLPGEIIKLKEEGEELSFAVNHFSPILLTASSQGNAATTHEFKAFWLDPADPKAGTANATTGHSYEDGSNGDIRSQTKLKIVPPDRTSNAVNTTTIGVNITLKGDQNTKYAPGRVEIRIPTRIFEGWTGDPDKITVSPSRVDVGGARVYYPVMPALTHGIPEAPNTNPQSSFNYTIDGDYFVLKNYKDLTGGLTFKADIAYNLTPSMLKVQRHEKVNGEEKGIYEKNFPITMTLKQEDGNTVEAKQSIDLSLRVETKVNPAKYILKHAEVDVNRGVYFTWNNEWGTPPADAGDYFYGVWFLKVERARGSSQPYDYKIEDLSVGSTNGELVGAKKLPMDWRNNNYFYNNPGGGREDALEAFGTNGYKDIAANMAAGAVPPAGKEYLENPIGKDQVGISKDPTIKFLPHYEPYVESGNYGPTGVANHQIYALLYRYPYTMLQKARDENPNFDQDGLTIPNDGKLRITETWADGFSRPVDVEPEGDMTVFTHPGGGGLFHNAKYNTQGGWNYIGILGLQSLFKDGVSSSLHYAWWVDSFVLSSEYQADNSKVNWNPDGSYRTSDDPSVPGSGTTITDGKYYLFSTNRSGIDGKLVSGKEFSEIQHDTGNRTDAYRGDVYKVKDEDYHYTKIFIKDMKMYDVERPANPLVKFDQKATPEADKQKYPPVDLYLRKKGESNYFKYGKFYYDASKYLLFEKYPSATNPDPVTEKGTADVRISSSNQLDLVKTFGTDIAGIKLVQDSNFYKSSFDAAFSMEMTPTAGMRKAIADTMARTDGYNTSFLAAPAEVEVRQAGHANPVFTNNRVGKYLGQIGYGLEPLIINSELRKSTEPYKDHPDTSKQTMRVHVTGNNYGSLPNSLKQDKYTKKYQLRKGVIYDLLPAGTSVDVNSIEVGAWDYQEEILPNRKIGQDKYSVTFEKNWEGSGQTMMIVKFEFPEDADHVYWNNSYNRSGWRLNYTLENPYTNIVDRGRSLKNTVGFVHTDEDRNWTSNFTEDKKPNIEKRKYYESLLNSAEMKGMSVVEQNMPFGPVMVLEATFSNTVATELDTRYLSSNTSYMGDPYSHRLIYQSSDTTRTTDLVMFDILGDDEKRNGDFSGVDIESLLEKRSYDKKNSNNQDKLKPRVFYSYSIPTSEQRDLGKPLYDQAAYNADDSVNNPKHPNSIWKRWDYENEANNAGIDKTKIKALAFDLRTTESGKRFILDRQGMALAYVKMDARTDETYLDITNVNKAYRNGVIFPGDEVPQNVTSETAEATSTHKLVKPVTFSIPVMKKLEVPAGLTGPDITNWFTFTLSAVDGAPLKDSSGNAIATVKSNPDPRGGMVKFGDIRILRPGKYTYKINESGRETGGVISKDMGDKYITINVKDPDHKALVADIKYTDNKPLTFTNIYGAEAVEPVIKVKKVLEAAPGLKKPDISGSFSFTLEGANGTEPMPLEAGGDSRFTRNNTEADGGEINLGTISLTKPGEYRYTITESGEHFGVVNDPNPTREIIITVRDYGIGKLIALMTGDEMTFTNTFEPNPNEGYVGITKQLGGAVPTENASFRFRLKPENTAEAQPMPGGSLEEEAIAEITGAGDTGFETIHFTKPGVFHYTVEEINDGVAGYTYDSSVYTVSFTVTQSKDNVYDLIAERKIYKNGTEVEKIVFDNQYNHNSGGGGGGNPPKPIPVGPVTPGGPGEKPKEPEKPTVPDVPEEPTPTPGENVPPTPTIPERIREIEKRIGEILGEGRKRPLTEAEKKELKRLGEVLGALRKEQSRKVRTADASHMIWYAFASAISCLCLALYYLVDRKKRRR